MPTIDWRWPALPTLPSPSEVIEQARQLAQPALDTLAQPYQPLVDLYENGRRRLDTPTPAQHAAAARMAGNREPESVSKSMLDGQWGQLFAYPGGRRVWVGQDDRAVDLTPNPQRDAEQRRRATERAAVARSRPLVLAQLGLPASVTDRAALEPSVLTIDEILETLQPIPVEDY